MGLSESEQHKLDEIERALLREAPRFAASISIRRARRRRRIFVGVVFLLGMMVLLIGLVATAQSVIVGVLISIVGLLAMLAGVLVLLRRPGRGS
jgi:fatty acid desaturase